MPRNDTPRRPGLSAEEMRRRQKERTEAAELRALIARELDKRGISEPSGLGRVFGFSLRAADKLLRRQQWREGDLIFLRAAAAKLGLM